MRLIELGKLLYYMQKLFFVKLRSILPLLFIFSLIMGSFVFLTKNTRILKPIVLICNEDSSLIGKMLLDGILDKKLERVVQFEEVSYEEGIDKVNRGFADSLIFIKKGTVETLYEGEKAEIKLFIRNKENDFSKFLAAYIRGFLEMVNTSQNAGLSYMDALSEEGMTREEKEKIFTEMQLTYSIKVLQRDEIFEKVEKKEFFFPKETILLFLVLFSLITLKKHEFMKREIRDRLILQGFKMRELIISCLLHKIIIDLEIYFLILFVLNNIEIG